VEPLQQRNRFLADEGEADRQGVAQRAGFVGRGEGDDFREPSVFEF